MPMNDTDKPFRKGSRRLNKSLPSLPRTTRPNLTVNTSFDQHGTRLPQQLYPAPNLAFRAQENFPRSQGNKAPSLATSQDTVRKAESDDPPPYQAQTATQTYEMTLQPRVFLQAPPSAKRNRRFKRHFLPKITTDVSPSDRAIPIGISLPSGGMRTTYTNDGRSSPKQGQTMKTPTIIITPAEEEFDFQFNGAADVANGPRPRSSVYSRRTNCFSVGIQQQDTPPVPPLPSYAMQPSGTAGREKDLPAVTRSTSNRDNYVSPVSSRALGWSYMSPETATPTPTPRRSTGWWNFVTSPFSAASATKSIFSPAFSIQKEEKLDVILPDASEDRFHASHQRGTVRNWPFRTPKRSNTAPAAMDPANADSVNIYRIPSQGLASSYYDPRRNYPSMSASAIRSLNLETGNGELPVTEEKAFGETIPRSEIERHLQPGDGAPFVDRTPGYNPPKQVTFSDRAVVLPPVDFPTEGAAVEPVLQTAPVPFDPPEPAPPKHNPKPVAVDRSRDFSAAGSYDDESDEEKGGEPFYTDTEEHDSPQQGRKHHRSRGCCISVILAVISMLLLVGLVVLLVMFIPFRHSNMPVQARWLNLTEFPAIPAGVSTVVGVKSTSDISSCVNPSALWSCAAPHVDDDIGTTQDNQPNFRLWIQGKGVVASPSPPPPVDSQVILSQSAGNSSSSSNGEVTPFHISLLDPGKLDTIPLQPAERSDLRKRRFRYPYPTPSDYNSSTSNENASKETIPSPELRLTGEPLPAQLYPLVYAQPLRLFNRGLPNEHYGFHTYFDRSLYVSGFSFNNTANSTTSPDSVSANVGLGEASAVCIWYQTRFEMKIWTRKTPVHSLLPVANASTIPAADSSANDFQIPGSFPYSVTFLVDRQGGDESEKGVYCYGLDDEQRVMKDVRTRIAVGGGKAGCGCQYQNFGGE